MYEPILITSCSRSGSSMVAGCFNLSGAWGGVMRGATSHNQKGMFENITIVETMVKPYLKGIGADPLGQYPLPSTENMIIPVFWNTAVESIILREGYIDGPWFYKEPKMCLMWPVWHVAYPKAQWIIVRRPDQDIINSCLRTPFMRAYKNTDGWGKWVAHHLRCFQEMKDMGLNVREIWSDNLIGGNYEELQEVIESCGLTYNKQILRDFIDPVLYTRS